MISTLQVPINKMVTQLLLFFLHCIALPTFCFDFLLKITDYLIHQRTMRPVSGYRGLHKAAVEGILLFTQLHVLLLGKNK